MNSHDIGRGRGGVAARRSPGIRAKSLVLGIDSDRYFPLDGQVEVAAGLAGSVHGDDPVLVHSEYGHDAFLIEHAVVGDALRAPPRRLRAARALPVAVHGTRAAAPTPLQFRMAAPVCRGA